ncbi:hypothetical protein [Dickeya lacustris]|uniref:Uncharacterized protein n=1 Tax=Dickeya lacustris TaxID=2259638 RepID=A0ABY8G4R7_9GAMM|nr:hypothetical protein [Dickeya lacustris]WFN54929.1 hypothetical protein O1Q98_14920 [Dickeya lacustris]
MNMQSGTGFAFSLRRPLAAAALLLGSLLSPTTHSAPPAANTLAASAGYAQCFQALSHMDGRRFTHITQGRLAMIYRDEPDYQADYHQPGDYLADGIFGPKTRKWLATFCAEFAIDPAPNRNRFAEDLLVALTKISELNQLFPFWRSRLSPPELLQWPTQKTIEFLNAQPPGEQAVVEPLPQGYYLLSDADLRTLSEHHRLQTQLDALTSQQFTNPAALNNAVRPLIRQLRGDEQQILQQIVETVPAPDRRPQRPNTAADDAREPGDSAEPEPESDSESALGSVSASASASASNSNRAPTAPAPVTLYAINPNALELAYLDLHLVSLDERALAQLATLKNIPFADRYHLQVALKLAGLSSLGSENWQRLVNLAYKPGLATPRLPAMVWRASEHCGCEESQPNISGPQALFYGFYPYWRPLTEGQSLNFRHLDRIGYFSASVLPGARGPQLVLPPNWRASRPEADFIRLAHRYRTDVDLVVSTPRKLSAPVLMSLLTTSLVTHLRDSIQTPLADDWVNLARPWLTFGHSAPYTQGDGLTLDFDLTRLTTHASQQAFIRFVQVLYRSLNPQPRPVDGAPLYAINLIVPPEALIAGQGFYRLENLRELLPYITLFILQTDSGDSPTPAPNTQTQLRNLHDFLSQQPQADVPALYRKMVPVLIHSGTQPSSAAFSELVRYSSWSFSGAAYWPLPLDEESQQVIERTFYPPETTLPAPLAYMARGVEQVMDVVCPNRWVLRLTLFVTFWLMALSWLVSLWFFPLRRIIESVWFSGFVVLFSAVLVLALLADPYWQQYQMLLLLLFAAIIVAILVRQHLRKNRRERNP